MSLATESIEPFDHPDLDVEAELVYIRKDGVRPVNYAYPAPAGVPQDGGQPHPQRMLIGNARALIQAPSLDRQGFALRAHRSALRGGSAFEDEARIRAEYYPETEALLRESTGAARVLVFDHTLRFDAGLHVAKGVREPVRRVHNDQTFESARRRVRDHVPAEEMELRLSQRFAIVNVWRPIGATVQTAPLALCDARSIDLGDLVACDLMYRDKIGEIYVLAHNPRHRWFYFPEVRTDEVVLIKIYDSRSDGVARFSAHTAFDHPVPAPHAPPRRSIELRCLLFWEDCP